MLDGVTEGTLMRKINLARVLLGGLLAGLVINVGELILNGMVLASEWAEFLEQLGLDPTFSAPQLVAGAVITFIYGIVLVWIYAAIRPRFGPGPRTAVIAGLTLWVLAYVLFTASLLAGGMFSTRLMVVTIVWGAFEAPLAGVVGAWVYLED
jgi:hypothetical protein